MGNIPVIFMTFLFMLFGFTDGFAMGRATEGYFEGALEIREKFPESKLGEGPLAFYGNKNAAFQINRNGWEGSIHVLDPNSNQPLMDPITFAGEFAPTYSHLWKMKMKISGLQTEFALRSEGNCFRGKSHPRKYRAVICMDEDEVLSFDVTKQDGQPVLKISAFPFSKPNLPTHRPLTLADAIQVALNTNPQSQAEFDKKRRARDFVTLDWLKLLPRISAPALASLGVPFPTNGMAYIQNMGTLAPFLSITNWANLADAIKESEIAAIGYTVFQANLINQVEQSVYVYRKDLALLLEYNELADTLEKVASNLESIAAIQPIGDLRDALQTAISFVKEEQAENNLANDKHSIAQSLGVHDLEIVRNIKIGPEFAPIEKADGTPTAKLSIVRVGDEASEVSLRYLERLQARKATEEARTERIFHPFKLLDPAGDSNDGIGPLLVAEFLLDKTKVTAAQNYERIVGDLITWNARNAAETYNDAIDGYFNAKKEREHLRTLLARILKPIHNFDASISHTDPIPLPESEKLKSMVREYLQFTDLFYGYHAAFRIARATIERAGLKYDYQQLLPQEDRVPLDPEQPEPRSPDDDELEDTVKIDMEEDQGLTYHINTSVITRRKGRIITRQKSAYLPGSKATKR